ncbi:MAG: phosphatidylglycerophosphatase A [Moraxella sp.]|nr:phosphatidylglycerophosphatase A [Moraxella sp.]
MTNHKPDIYKSNICPPCPPTATTFEKCVYWLGIGLGSGLPKRAAGTWGTLGGLIVAMPLIAFGIAPFFIVTLLGLLAGSYICGCTSTLMGIEDDPHIVWDEWVGIWLTLLPAVFVLTYFKQIFGEFGFSGYLWATLVAGFVLFRIFDVIKPAPVSWADKHVSGGFGILLDDVLAGIIAGLVLVIGVFYFLPSS